MKALARRAWLISMAPLAAWAMAGCQSLPSLDGALPLRYSGRLAVQVAGDAERSFSAGFELMGNPARGALALTTPLGTLHGRAEWSPQTVRLVTSEGTQGYASLDDLSRDLLGEVVPLLALFDWLAGRPTDLAGSRPRSSDPAAGFEQLGWHIDLQRRAEGLIVASRPEPSPRLTVRAKLDPR